MIAQSSELFRNEQFQLEKGRSSLATRLRGGGNNGIKVTIFEKLFFSSILLFASSVSFASNIDETSEIECLTKVVYYEARGESEDSQMAVGFVPINRLKSGKFPDTICKIVYQRVKRTCQFSWVCNRKHGKVDKELYNDLKKIAMNIYHNHNKMHDPTRGATYFKSSKCKSRWSKKMYMKTAKIGHHDYYRVNG